MTIPFRHGRDEQSTSSAGLTEGQIMARLQALDSEARSGDQAFLARGRVWERLVSEHPSLGQTAATVQVRRPAPAANCVTASPVRRSPMPIGRRSAGGWRAAMDVAAVAALVIGLVLGARGVGIMPRGGNPNPMMTQSVAAAPATEAVTPNEAGTNRQPGPGPQMMPIAEWTGEYASAVEFGNNRLYATDLSSTQPQPDLTGTPAATTTSPVTAYDIDPLTSAWTTSVAGSTQDLSVSGDSVTVLTYDDSRTTTGVISLDASSGGIQWSVELPRFGFGLQSNDRTVLLVTFGETEHALTLQALDSQTGGTRWSRDIPASTLLQPVLADTQIAYGTETGSVHLLDAASGKDIWVADTGTTGIAAAPIIGSDAVYVITGDLVMYAFDRQSGDHRWGTGVGAPGVPPLTWYGPPDEPVFDGEQAPLVHTGSEPMLALAGDQVIVQFIWSSDELNALADWSVPLPFESLRYDLVALDPVTGHQNWRQDAVSQPGGKQQGRNASQPVVDGEQIYLTTDDATAARSLEDGHLIWQTGLPFPTFSSPIVVDGEMYLVSTTVLSVLHEPVSMPSTATPAATPVS